MDTLTKLGILADAAKYDAACTSSGVSRGPSKGKLGIASDAGCCHAFTADGRCVTLLKVLMSNACSYDCAYCVNRRSNTVPRATFTPRELAQLTVDFYKRNYIEGLFLSSGVMGTPDATTERMISCLELLRGEMRFNGYVHAKAIPGTSPDLIDRLGRLADRLSVNVELPSAGSLSALCPDKTSSAITAPMAQIASTIVGERRLGAGDGRRDSTQADGLAQVPRSDANRRRAGLGRRGARAGSFAPAGQATQLIIGASPEDDNHILQLSRSMYERFGLKRVFFSAYMPVVDDPVLPCPGTPVPLRREHRLYQADWLMRYYSFSPDELVSAEEPWLDLDVDPKLAWALRNIDRFPIEVNEAPLEQLLRVPGIGVTGARKIVRARRGHALTFDDLGRLRIVMRRARHFVTCSDSIDPACPLDAELIRQRVVSDASSSRYNRTQRAADRQLSLF
ncbi:MAG: putative DNA modification/repair radical SAM protein [Atopobiaceae bacterium]|jgi:putative DNA modification/repair radical SAM protein|nr:putative DNA modification/repair radical SAM protein [Atopobiaceae bacterium]MCI2173371.1 putative DNA modification/repair radical SAM protein [Atopobiaceae bacterium]MCI2207366.1 putative DNA modification/repair radical SAM protein [Atopobiaceae bacterium]